MTTSSLIGLRFPPSVSPAISRGTVAALLVAAVVLAAPPSVVAQVTASPAPARQPLGAGQRSAGARAEHASSKSAPGTDSRWFAWLGCWQGDSTTFAGMKCIVPAPETNTVDELTLAKGKVVARDRLDISGRPHQIRQQGCDGSESVSWSPSGRRVYLRSDYVCATGIKGTSTRMFAILPSGEWLEVEEVRAGGGSLVHATQRRDVGVPAGAPAEMAEALGAQQLAVNAARANAAAVLTTDDVLEALRSTDAPTVRSWLVATNQTFALDAEQVASLVHADVPTSVLQAMMASASARELGVAPMRSAASDDYLNTPVYAPGAANQAVQMNYGVSQFPNGTTCTPYGCVGSGMYPPYSGYSTYNGAGYYPYSTYSTFVPYPVYSAPIIVRRGHQGAGRPFPTHPGPTRPAPTPHGPVGRRP